ncbi:MAG: hypothetical protein AB7V40_12280 [Methyloceanibacter sp.]
MRGFIAVLLLLWCMPAFAQATGGSPHHGIFAPSDVASEGHALDSGAPLLEQETGATDLCIRGEGVAGTAGYYACRVKTLLFGSIERSLLLITALLALSTLALWFYTRRVANAAKAAAEHVPAVERAYVFGGPTDLFLLQDQATVRLAMQNYGKTPAVIREWLVEFLAQEPRGKKPGYDVSKRTLTNEILEPFKLFSPAAVFRSEIPAPFYIVGYIVYDDVSRRSHTTRFCVAVARDGKAAFSRHPEWYAYD